jgi:hypothetical protein
MNYISEEHSDDELVHLMTAGTHSLLFDVREKLMTRSEIGQRYLRLYKTHGLALFKLCCTDRDFRRSVLRCFFMLATLSRGMLRYTADRSIKPDSEWSFTPAMYGRAVSLVEMLAVLGASKAFQDDARGVISEVGAFVGLSASELVDRLVEA